MTTTREQQKQENRAKLVAAARKVEKHVLPLIASGAVRVPVAETFALDEAEAGYDRFAQGGKLGKIVLTT